MTATETLPAATAAPTKWEDVLPVRGGSRYGLEWMPHAEDFAHGEGFVVLTSKRDRTAYAVTATNGEHALLYFVFTKVGESKGTDAGRESYLLNCTVNGNEPKCDCKGHVRHGYCRHSDAISTLIINRWL